MKKHLLFPALLLLLHCAGPTPPDTAGWKEEVRQAEEAFDALAAEQGIKTAFLAFAAEDAVLLRGERLIEGKAAITQYFDQQDLEQVQLRWKPDFIDVAADGSLAYTYGKYTFSAPDSSGQTRESSGMFHTVWKRQPDGSWKFVYD